MFLYKLYTRNVFQTVVIYTILVMQKTHTDFDFQITTKVFRAIPKLQIEIVYCSNNQYAVYLRIL